MMKNRMFVKSCLLLTTVLMLASCRMMDATRRLVDKTVDVVDSTSSLANSVPGSSKQNGASGFGEKVEKLTTPLADICKEGVKNPMRLESYRGKQISDTGTLKELKIAIGGKFEYNENEDNTQFRDYDISVDMAHYSVYGVIDRDVAKKLDLEGKVNITGIIRDIGASIHKSIDYDDKKGITEENSVICTVHLSRIRINKS